jgi:hypothetical protein
MNLLQSQSLDTHLAVTTTAAVLVYNYTGSCLLTDRLTGRTHANAICTILVRRTLHAEVFVRNSPSVDQYHARQVLTVTPIQIGLTHTPSTHTLPGLHCIRLGHSSSRLTLSSLLTSTPRHCGTAHNPAVHILGRLHYMTKRPCQQTIQHAGAMLYLPSLRNYRSSSYP